MTALLAMDLQRGILERYSASGYLERVAQAIEAARAAGVPVIHVRVAFRAGHPEVGARNRAFVALRDGGRLIEGDPATDIHEAVAPREGEPVVTKKRVSAFAGSDLDVLLRARGIRELVVCGVATSGVVLSTVRAAADLDYGLTVLADGCLDADDEVHRVLTEKVFPRQADVITVSDWMKTIA